MRVLKYSSLLFLLEIRGRSATVWQKPPADPSMRYDPEAVGLDPTLYRRCPVRHVIASLVYGSALRIVYSYLLLLVVRDHEKYDQNPQSPKRMDGKFVPV